MIKQFLTRSSERNNNDDKTISVQCDEPLYFNITEENPISWQDYYEICK